MLMNEEVEPASQHVDPAERRATPRKALQVEVGFATDSNFYAGFTEDISEGGLFVATIMLQPVGSRISLTFGLPDGSEIMTTGVVRWLRDPRNDHDDCVPGMGVQFDDLSADELALIREFISLREPIFFEA